MAADLDVELTLPPRVRAGAQRADRLLLSARRILPIERPRDRLEQRGLSRAVRTEDARQPRLEGDEGVDVLAEVREPECVEPHLRLDARRMRRRGAVALLGVLQ